MSSDLPVAAPSAAPVSVRKRTRKPRKKTPAAKARDAMCSLLAREIQENPEKFTEDKENLQLLMKCATQMAPRAAPEIPAMSASGQGGGELTVKYTQTWGGALVRDDLDDGALDLEPVPPTRDIPHVIEVEAQDAPCRK